MCRTSLVSRFCKLRKHVKWTEVSEILKKGKDDLNELQMG